MQSKDILKRLGNNAGNLLSYLDKIYASNNNIILVGSQESGKTTLLNKLCGTSFEINSTKVPQCAESIHKGDFIAIDFPPFNSHEDQLIKYKIYKTVLSNIPVKMICFVVQFGRTQIDFINMYEKIFEGYKDNIVIIISQCDNYIKDTALIENNIKKYTKFKRIIVSFKDKDNETILYDQLIIYMSKMNNIPNMMIKSINLIDIMPIDGHFFIEEQDNFIKTINLFREKSKEYKDIPEAQRALFFAFKSYKKKFLKKFSKSLITKDMNFSDIDKLILELIFFCKMIKSDVYPLITSLRVGLQFGVYSDNFDETIRKCPCCGTLWIRYVGSGAIICGRREHFTHDSLSDYPKNYMVKLFNDKLIVEEDKYHNKLKSIGKCYFPLDEPNVYNTKTTNLGFPTNSWLLSEEEKKRNEFLEMNNKSKIKPVGCLFRFIWYEAEDVTKEAIDLFDKNLYNDFTDYYSDVFEIEQELKIKVAIDEVKNKLIKEIKDEKKISYILETFENYEKFKISHPENLDLVVEYSSVTKDSEDLKNITTNKYFINSIIKCLYDIGYYNIEY